MMMMMHSHLASGTFFLSHMAGLAWSDYCEILAASATQYFSAYGEDIPARFSFLATMHAQSEVLILLNKSK